MFCAKTHNMGFVSPVDKQNANCALAGGSPSGKGLALNPVLCGQQKKGLDRPSLLPIASIRAITNLYRTPRFGVRLIPQL